MTPGEWVSIINGGGVACDEHKGNGRGFKCPRCIERGIAEAVAEERVHDRLRNAMALDTPHPLPDVFERLMAATDHLFVVHGCDGHGWEIWQTALRESFGLIDGLRAALRKP